MIESIVIPEGVSCELSGKTLSCKKGSETLSRKIIGSELEISIKDGKIIIECKKGNRSDYASIKSLEAHIKNMFTGLNHSFTYSLEACNVRFPMTLKIDGNKFIVTNFLGEKTPRLAKIVSGAKVEIKGQKIMVSSNDKESAGQTAANIEKATRVRNRDRRIFQDGIYIVSKPGSESQ